MDEELISDRLRKARINAGYSTASEASEAFGWKQQTYLAHENGSRGIRYEKAERYARAFRINLDWLWRGLGEMKGDPGTVPLVGSIGAGAELYPVDDHAQGAGLEYVEAPPGAKDGVVAVRVSGNSMYPAYQDGDLLYYDQHNGGHLDAINRECIVRLEDGRVFVKRVIAGSEPGRYTLMSYNDEPIVNVKVVWTAPIKWVKKS